eukprot:11887245-Alexandrium_andersonii.AAC.1
MSAEQPDSRDEDANRSNSHASRECDGSWGSWRDAHSSWSWRGTSSWGSAARCQWGASIWGSDGASSAGAGRRDSLDVSTASTCPGEEK